MSRSDSVVGHALDVSVILVLGAVYVLALAAGSVATRLVSECKRIGSFGMALRDRFRGGTGPTP